MSDRESDSVVYDTLQSKYLRLLSYTFEIKYVKASCAFMLLQCCKSFHMIAYSWGIMTKS